MTSLPTPTPVPDLETQEFWDATAQGKLLLKQCPNCHAVIWYPRVHCTQCGNPETTWIEASGRGSVYSFTVVRRARGRGFAEATPYVIALVELEEGPRLITNVIGCDPDDVRIDQAVRLVFDPTENGYGLYRFTPA